MKPIVLVHGMYLGGWSWRKVAAPLRAAGHTVYAPSLTGCGDRIHLSKPGVTIETHGLDIANLITYENLRDVVLVATSSGGMGAARAMELVPDRISHLVLVDALVPEAGSTAVDTVPPQWRATWEAFLDAETDSIAMSPSSVTMLQAQLEPDDAEAVGTVSTTYPRALMFDTVDLKEFWKGNFRSTVVFCEKTHNPPEPIQRRTAELLKSDWRTIDTGHLPFFSEPRALAEIIADISR